MRAGPRGPGSVEALVGFAIMVTQGERTMRIVVLLTAVVAAACGNGATAPSTAQPVRAAGTWRGALRVTSGTGEPCVGAAFQTAAGISIEYTLAVRQSGDQLTATSMSPATGIVCQLTGIAQPSSIVLTLTTCDAPAPRFFSCDGIAFRDARPSAVTINADVTGNSLSGSYAEAYDVFDYGTTTKLGIATLNAQLTLSSQ